MFACLKETYNDPDLKYLSTVMSYLNCLYNFHPNGVSIKEKLHNVVKKKTPYGYFDGYCDCDMIHD